MTTLHASCLGHFPAEKPPSGGVRVRAGSRRVRGSPGRADAGVWGAPRASLGSPGALGPLPQGWRGPCPSSHHPLHGATRQRSHRTLRITGSLNQSGSPNTPTAASPRVAHRDDAWRARSVDCRKRRGSDRLRYGPHGRACGPHFHAGERGTGRAHAGREEAPRRQGATKASQGLSVRWLWWVPVVL